MGDEFEDIVASFRESPDIEPKSKRQALEAVLAEKREARKIRRRQQRCMLTWPFGHFYESRKVKGAVYPQNVCMWCDRIDRYNDPDITPGMVLTVIIVAAFLATLLILFLR